jgi:hypothetical protein
MAAHRKSLGQAPLPTLTITFDQLLRRMEQQRALAREMKKIASAMRARAKEMTSQSRPPILP